MELKQIENFIKENKGGQFHAVEWHKELKTRKGIDARVSKQSTAVIRIGVQYDNKQAVIEKRENGELPSENQGLPYGEWAIYPYLIKHNGGYQLRVTTAQNTAIKSQYFMNGVPCNKSDIAELVLKSEIPSPTDKPIDVFNLKIENIDSIK